MEQRKMAERNRQNWTRRSFLKATGFVAASGLLGGCASRPKRLAGPGQPNIIFILADDLGYGDLGCYGQQKIRTPNIDRMAAEGMLFTDCYAGSTVCAPSRCSLMTGLHTGHAHVRGNKEAKPMGQLPLPPDAVTVPKLLKSRGYVTGLIGKWGLGGPGSSGAPNNQGFDYSFGYLCQRHAHNYYPEFLFRNDERVPLANKVAGDRTDGAGVATEKVQYSHDLFAEEALQFIEQNRQLPFFLYLALTIPHANNEAGQQGMEVPSYGPYAGEDWPEPQKGRAAMITRMDGDVGRLLDKLKALGIDEDTLVLFSSDNGPHKEGGADSAFFDSNGPLRGIKRDLYEGGVRVPLIARWPGRIAAGSGTDHVCAFWDFLPTCCDLAGAVPPDDTDGFSILPTLLGKPGQQRRHRYLYWEFHEQGKKQAVRMGDWKGVRLNVANDPDGPIELYDLRTDLGETTNLADEYPETVTQIASLMKAARRPSEAWPFP
ncbi:MAG: sulfatase-like hydrolase/transferase [Sedimentisphaerales bacterium]|jgi:arylsulfatase A-like enzyme|nr:sulfatase-like hydrolase/transferase [Sedimentisphaerales bacterium]HNY80452.1 sulfatase-like hydrolase/transferase [Sedimentisphaerales bacterium]HOC65293.1 sulfatase-like hydrolase/transferase [Sedimentisphaerales bacterium]HOH66217.1 sulfatase-like hydrolase/transferase [Sedimentisphaerales bacterium]HQN32068.1 sulfatase-like hydrolase/transferase [Sedimentisphaerales bacterium]